MLRFRQIVMGFEWVNCNTAIEQNTACPGVGTRLLNRHCRQQTVLAALNEVTAGESRLIGGREGASPCFCYCVPGHRLRDWELRGGVEGGVNTCSTSNLCCCYYCYFIIKWSKTKTAVWKPPIIIIVDCYVSN